MWQEKRLGSGIGSLLSGYFIQNSWKPLSEEVPDWIQSLGNLLFVRLDSPKRVPALESLF